MHSSTAASWHVPYISVSPHPLLEPPVVPSSSSHSQVTSSRGVAFRSRHLTQPSSPPPTLTTSLSYVEGTLRARGREPFQAFLRASIMRHTNRAGDSRKKVALNACTNAQTLGFLSRILAPPSPTATLTPKTPPDSPAIFHYTLPSPGLVSPLTLFEKFGKGSTYGTLSHGCEPWVEEVDFRSSGYYNPRIVDDSFDVARDHKGMPSLDQISARMTSQGRFCTPDSESASKRATRLPTFLTSRIPERLPITGYQSKMPIGPSKSHIASSAVPRCTTLALPGLRKRRAQDMVSTLKRRTMSSEQCLTELDGTSERSRKRNSAPPETSPLRQRDGFKHPVLLLPGGF